MEIGLGAGVPALVVFAQGLLSFFSPCVLPLVPLYLGYLAGGAKGAGEDEAPRRRRGRLLLNTLFFVLGISFAFFALGLGFSALGRFFAGGRVWFSRAAGVLIILFGLYQLGVFSPGFLGRERRLPFSLDSLAMNPLLALVLGFTFSFAWTPCVGPALTSVLLMASASASAAAGWALVGLYTLGFVLPFLAVGLFAGGVLGFFRRHQKALACTTKVGGVLMILMGVLTLTGALNRISVFLASVS